MEEPLWKTKLSQDQPLGMKEQDLPCLSVSRKEVMQIQEDFTLDLRPENMNDGQGHSFSEEVVALLHRFNEHPRALKKAILLCAENIQQNVPELVKQAVSSQNNPNVQLADWWQGCPKQANLLRQHADSLIAEIRRKGATHKRSQALKTQALAMGLEINWSAVSESASTLWADSKVRSITFCLVELAQNTVVMQKAYGYDSVRSQDYGSAWKIKPNRTKFNNDEGADFAYSGRGVALTPTNFRLAHILEIVAILSSVTHIDGLPSRFMCSS